MVAYWSKVFNQWLNKVLKEAENEENQYLLPPVQALKHLIESDRYIYNITQLMFEEIPVNDVDTPTWYSTKSVIMNKCF